MAKKSKEGKISVKFTYTNEGGTELEDAKHFRSIGTLFTQMADLIESGVPMKEICRAIDVALLKHPEVSRG